MTVNSQRLLLAAAGAGGAAAAGLYVDDVFSTFLYEGNGSSQTITNGIDLEGEGGMVYGGHRSGTSIGNPDRFIYDTERGVEKAIYPSSTSAEVTDDNGISAFNSDGFTLPSGNARHNDNGYDYVSWTFRKAPGFFDVVTYTGTGSARTVAHNLGSVPGTIIVKRTNTTSSWYVYHRSLGATKEIRLNNTNAENTSSIYWNDTEPTSSVFTVGTSAGVNGSGDTYVAYLFAHDEQSFGTDSDEAIIKCGSYTGAGANQQVDIGFEPQWLLIRGSSNGGDWSIYDSMRTGDRVLLAQSSGAETDVSSTKAIDILSDGFQLPSAEYGDLNASGRTYIYVAIRRPHKPPEDATDVFAMDTGNSSSTTPTYDSNFPVDFAISRIVTGGDIPYFTSRLTGTAKLRSNATFAESTDADYTWDSNVGWGKNWYSDYQSWMFRRAPGFVDVVTYLGTSSARTINHNLGVVPELMIVKARSSTGGAWVVFHKDADIQDYIQLQSNAAATDFGSPGAFNNTDPTSSVFSVSGAGWDVNNNGTYYINYLFASLAGISKVGSYTGTGSNVGVNCGFTAGARFVLIKRTDSTGDWYLYDSLRGIVGGNDPYLLLNSTAAPVTNTDYIDPLNSGFTVTSSAPAALNASGGTYIFLAIA